MRLLESSREDVNRDKYVEDVPKLESVEVDLVNNKYQQASKVLFTFVQNKQFGQLITIAPQSLTVLSTTNTEFLSIAVWFTDQNSNQLEIEDNVNMALIIG